MSESSKVAGKCSVVSGLCLNSLTAPLSPIGMLPHRLSMRMDDFMLPPAAQPRDNASRMEPQIDDTRGRLAVRILISPT